MGLASLPRSGLSSFGFTKSDNDAAAGGHGRTWSAPPPLSVHNEAHRETDYFFLLFSNFPKSR